MVSGDDIINGWLRYHGTTVQEVVEKHPEEAKSGEWFDLYPVTQEQHDQWEDWAKEYIRKKTKFSKKRIERGWGLTYLYAAPKIKP